jgi:hypothetical protein
VIISSGVLVPAEHVGSPASWQPRKSTSERRRVSPLRVVRGEEEHMFRKKHQGPPDRPFQHTDDCKI